MKLPSCQKIIAYSVSPALMLPDCINHKCQWSLQVTSWLLTKGLHLSLLNSKVKGNVAFRIIISIILPWHFSPAFSFAFQPDSGDECHLLIHWRELPQLNLTLRYLKCYNLKCCINMLSCFFRKKYFIKERNFHEKRSRFTVTKTSSFPPRLG